MKNLISILILLVFFAGCVNIQKREKIFKYPESKNLKKYYESWDLENAFKELNLLIEKDPDNKTFQAFLKKIEKRNKQKKEFDDILEEIVNDLSLNNTDSLEKYIKKSVENKIKLSYIKDKDLSEFNIFKSRAKFNKNSSNVIIALNYLDETIYIEVYFVLEKKGWKIDQVEERR